MTEHPTLRQLVGMAEQPAATAESKLIMIDCQNTYTYGVLELDGAQAALEQAAELLDRALSHRADGRAIGCLTDALARHDPARKWDQPAPKDAPPGSPITAGDFARLRRRSAGIAKATGRRNPDMTSFRPGGIPIGAFLTATTSFLTLAFVVHFFVVTPYNRLQARMAKGEEAAPPSPDTALLTEIRDLLASRPR